MLLEKYSEDIKRIIDAVAHAYNIEAAVFDGQCRLIACTKGYEEKKGSNVHRPSLIEVISKGNILVNKPGHMESCKGCRFQDHCPATIEILSTIIIDRQPAGAISFTSFTEEGHERLTKNLDAYVDLLNEASFLISSMILHNSQDSGSLSENTLKSILEISNDSLLMVDSSGMIKYGNKAAHKLFPTCALQPLSLSGLFPGDCIEEILQGGNISNKHVKSSSGPVILSSVPIFEGSRQSGAVISIAPGYRHGKSQKRLEAGGPADSYTEAIKGNSLPIRELKAKIKKIAKSDSSVFIKGETGTGKELFAKAIHYNSSRSSFPFISINCASIPEALFESELFGYEEGAFTGAKRGGKIGKFELAQGGTLFLDEIGEMPMYMQAKLLRVLQELTIERVGGTHSIPVDIRIIAATNQNIEKMISDGKFRIDLFYRFNVISLTIPPLRQRDGDTEILAVHFLDKYNRRLNKAIEGFTPEAIAALKNHSWPGNVRELENTIEYAVNMEDGRSITCASLPDCLRAHSTDCGFQIKDKVRHLEIEAIREVLDRNGWDLDGKKKTAEELGIGLRTLYRKLKAAEN